MSAGDGAGELAVLIQQLNDLLEPIIEATAGYKAEAVRRGFNETAANSMAASYHDVLMTVMKNKAFGAPS